MKRKSLFIGFALVLILALIGNDNVSGCVNIDNSLAHDIQRHPAQYYLLLTDESYPDGAARAQLAK